MWRALLSVSDKAVITVNTWVWHSQPFITDTLAANLLLSTAILFTGSTPGKVFHFLECLHVACTTNRTFHLHHPQYLQPTVCMELPPTSNITNHYQEGLTTYSWWRWKKWQTRSFSKIWYYWPGYKSCFTYRACAGIQYQPCISILCISIIITEQWSKVQ